jgi:hypothetical protein
MFKKLKIKYKKSSQNVHIIWMTWGKKFRWISFECSTPAWWLPKYEKFNKGTRFGWLVFAIGTGVVTREQMDALNMMQIQ